MLNTETSALFVDFTAKADAVDRSEISPVPTVPIAPIDPAVIAKSESTTAVILATAVLISVLISSISGLLMVVLTARRIR